MKGMQILPFLLCMLIPLTSSQGTRGEYGEWKTAHATFYGGSDATGTMGMLQTNQLDLYICIFICTGY